MYDVHSDYDGSVVFEARLDTSAFTSSVSQLGEALSAMIAEIQGSSDAAVQIGEAILTALSPLPSQTAAAAVSAADAFLSPFSALPGQTAQWAQSVVSALLFPLSSLSRQTGDSAMSAAEAFLSPLSELPSRAAALFQTLKYSALSALSDLPASLSQLGQNAVSGLASSLSNTASRISSSVSGLLSNVVSSAKAVLEIRSPSQVMAREVGVPMAQGVMAGFDSVLPDMSRSFSDLIRSPHASVPSPSSVNTSSADSSLHSGDLYLGGVQIYWYGGSDDVDVDHLARQLGQRIYANIRSSGCHW